MKPTKTMVKHEEKPLFNLAKGECDFQIVTDSRFSIVITRYLIGDC